MHSSLSGCRVSMSLLISRPLWNYRDWMQVLMCGHHWVRRCNPSMSMVNVDNWMIPMEYQDGGPRWKVNTPNRKWSKYVMGWYKQILSTGILKMMMLHGSDDKIPLMTQLLTGTYPFYSRMKQKRGEVGAPFAYLSDRHHFHHLNQVKFKDSKVRTSVQSWMGLYRLLR